MKPHWFLHALMLLYIITLLCFLIIYTSCGKCAGDECNKASVATCPEGTTLEADGCYYTPECPEGTTATDQGCWYPGTCPADSVVGEGGKCFFIPVCPDDTIPTDDGRCLYIPECPEGTTFIDGACQPPVECPTPWVLVNGTCTYPICTPNTQAFDCACSSTATVKQANGLTYCCGGTTALIIANCITCPAGEHEDTQTRKCVCNTGTVRNPCTNLCEVAK